MPDTPDLAALLGSRICHDLISPIGAIGNGVELLMMAGAEHGPEIALIAESVGYANARIRFFRVAFGTATADQRMARAEIASILADQADRAALKLLADRTPLVRRLHYRRWCFAFGDIHEPASALRGRLGAIAAE